MAPPGPKCLIPNGDSQNSHNDAAQIIQKLHQLEVGQKKIIHLLKNLDKELSAREKRQGQCCFKHNNSSLNNGSIKSTSSHQQSNRPLQGWVREEDSGNEGERLVKIQLQDATTSTKHVGFRIDKSCQTPMDNDLECSCVNSSSSEAIPGQEDELIRLRKELREATESLAKAMPVNTKGEINFGAESPLNLFIQCFKEKYGLVVNPNDVAIFV